MELFSKKWKKVSKIPLKDRILYMLKSENEDHYMYALRHLMAHSAPHVQQRIDHFIQRETYKSLELLVHKDIKLMIEKMN